MEFSEVYGSTAPLLSIITYYTPEFKRDYTCILMTIAHYLIAYWSISIFSTFDSIIYTSWFSVIMVYFLPECNTLILKNDRSLNFTYLKYLGANVGVWQNQMFDWNSSLPKCIIWNPKLKFRKKISYKRGILSSKWWLHQSLCLFCCCYEFKFLMRIKKVKFFSWIPFMPRSIINKFYK